MDFTGKRVLITGAGKGIGLQVALRVAALGGEVVALARTTADLEALRDRIGARIVSVDLGDAGQAARAAKEGTPADLLVNCAGTNILEPFLDVSVESFDRVQNVNLRAALIVSQVYARRRIEAGQGGAIVNVSSISSFVGFRDHAAYCASKAGLDGLSRVMANELGPHGIRVNCVNPIVTMTELAAEAWSDPAKSDPVMRRIPLRRFAETDDVAEVIAFLLSDGAAMVNGLAVPIDGGFLTN